MILIGCEESGTLTNAFRKAGYIAFSCDIEDTRGNPEWHLKCDIFEAIKSRKWDLIILHPDCTALAVSGNRTYAAGKKKHYLRKRAIAWTKKLWKFAISQCEYVALENPKSVIFQYLKEADFVFSTQPYDHGHGETKETRFATKNLPPLKPTRKVKGREQKVWLMAPSPTRKRDRAKTYSGIANAIVKQWGKYVQRNYN